MHHAIRTRVLNHFFFAVYLAILAIGSQYWPAEGFSGTKVALFALGVHLTYVFI